MNWLANRKKRREERTLTNIVLALRAQVDNDCVCGAWVVPITPGEDTAILLLAGTKYPDGRDIEDDVFDHLHATVDGVKDIAEKHNRMGAEPQIRDHLKVLQGGKG